MTTTALQAYCLSLMRAARDWRRLADAVVRPHGLSDALAHPLVLIARQGGLRQTTLAEAMGIEGPSLVRSLDQLCALGLVARIEDASDRRAKCLHLTEKGRLLTEAIVPDLEALRRQVFAGVSDDEIAAGLRMFGHIAVATGSDAEEVA